MHIGIFLTQKRFGDHETTSFVARVSQHGKEIKVDFDYIFNDSCPQEGGWFVLSTDQARQLGESLIAVVGGYTRGEQSSFTGDHDLVTSSSIGR